MRKRDLKKWILESGHVTTIDCPGRRTVWEPETPPSSPYCVPSLYAREKEMIMLQENKIHRQAMN